MSQNVSCLPEMTVFDKKYQFLLENDDYLIKYVYFLKNKSTKVRGGAAFGENSFLRNDLLKNKCPQKSVFHQK